MRNKEVMLRVEGLRLSLGGREIFHIDDLRIHKGEVLALVGPNGARWDAKRAAWPATGCHGACIASPNRNRA